ncbi:nuclear transport factor 2 family protein [Streptomyces sp. NPDC101178]|uniref:nuclear transport factor 2 family protein n=1 Tax=Streptomyces sp. NPDC101178 TaxID=3366124 RepID=UPI003822B270
MAGPAGSAGAVNGAGLGELAAEVARLSDIVALNHLIDRYLAGLDEGLGSFTEPGSGSGFDAAWAASLFTEDVELLFPVGSHQGLAGADGFLREIMERWGRTHHHGSLATVEPDGDRAAVSWSLIASHVHVGSPVPPQPSAYFQIGGRFSGVARRTAAGWRFARLRLRIVWSTGSPPGGITEVDARTLAATDSRT